MENEFHAVRRLPPYVFAEVNKIKAVDFTKQFQPRAKCCGRAFGLGEDEVAHRKDSEMQSQASCSDLVPFGRRRMAMS